MLNTVGSFRNRVEGAELILFQESSHTAHLEESERCLEVVRAFLQRPEGVAAP
jgi:hypothetical protein